MKNSNEEDKDTWGLIHNACVCEIDIVNYTRWCLINPSNVVYKTMKAYNEFVLDKLSRFEFLHKIELVGDSVLIVGKHKELPILCSSMIRLCNELLRNIDVLRDIFQFDEFDLRVGIHVDDVYGGCIRSPDRLQVFGKAVNIACRLESLAIPSTIHISEDVLNIIEDNKSLLSSFSVGKTQLKNLKGIGDMNAVTLFAKRESGMIADDNKSQLLMLGHIIDKQYNKTYIQVSSMKECFDILRKQYFEDVVVLDRFFEHEDSYPHLLSFKKWEVEHRKERQQFILISADESIMRLHEDKVYKDGTFIQKFKETFENIVSPY